MTLDELLSAVDALVSQRETERTSREGEGNFRCEECVGCRQCRFCVACVECEECTYCEGCLDCRGCTQCKRSAGCRDASYVDDSRDCSSSKYLLLCVDCRDCTYCLGCVGLHGAEFHVLNKPVERKQYFAFAKELKEVLEARAAEGFRPGFVFPEGFEDEDAAEVSAEPEADAVDDDAATRDGAEDPAYHGGSDGGSDRGSDGVPRVHVDDVDPWLEAPKFASRPIAPPPEMSRLSADDLREEDERSSSRSPGDELDLDPWLGPIEDDLGEAPSAARGSLARGTRPSSASSAALARNSDVLRRETAPPEQSQALGREESKRQRASVQEDGRSAAVARRVSPARGAADPGSGSYSTSGRTPLRAEAVPIRSPSSDSSARRSDPSSGTSGAAELIRRADWTSSASGSGSSGGASSARVNPAISPEPIAESRVARPHSRTDIASTWSARELRAWAEQAADDEDSRRGENEHEPARSPASPGQTESGRVSASAKDTHSTGSARWSRTSAVHPESGDPHKPWHQDAWGNEDLAYPHTVDDERPSEPIELDHRRAAASIPAENSLRRGTRPKAPPRR